jgi:hypothetical protein
MTLFYGLSSPIVLQLPFSKVKLFFSPLSRFQKEPNFFLFELPLLTRVKGGKRVTI